MKSIALLIVGVITGVAAGVFSTSRINQPKNLPEPVAPATTVQQSKDIASPFSPINDAAPKTTIVAEQIPNHQQSAPTTVTTQPDKTLSESKHYREVISYLQYIDTANSDELLALLPEVKKSNGNSPFARTINTAIYQRFSEVDIEAALDHAISEIENTRNQYSHWAHEGLSVLASLEPDFVRDRIESIDSDAPYSSLKTAMYAGIASNDPEQFARQIVEDREGDEPLRDEALSMAISEWAIQDPQAAWDFLQTEADEQTRSMQADQILYMWFERDPDAALVEIEALLNNGSSNPEQQYMLTDLYVSHLSRTDPDAAYQWALSQDDPMLKENALMTVLHNWDVNDTAGLESFINQMDPTMAERYMPMAISALANNMAETDPDRAMKWAEQLPEAQGFEAKMNIVSQWAHTNPDAAAEWLFNLPDTPGNDLLIQSSAGSFLYGNPETAKQVFSRMPPNIQSGLTQQMMMTLEPQAAREWLNEQTNPEVQQIGSIILTATDPNTDTNTVLDQIAGLQQSNHRQGMLFNAIGERMRTDRPAVQQWISNTNLLSADERDMLQQMTPEFNRFGLPFRDPGLYSIEYNNRIEH